MNKQDLCYTVNDELIKYFGEPKREKKFSSLVDILVATILSQNTNDKLSESAFCSLKSEFPNWEDVSQASLSKIKNSIKIAGLANQKSKFIKDFLIDLKKKHKKINLNYLKKLDSNEIFEELSRYKGIGTKTIACLLLFGLKRDVLPVDTHVHRILNRTGILKTNNPMETFSEYERIKCEAISYSFHINLIRLGRNFCRPKNPSCKICPIEKLCKFKEKNFNFQRSKNNISEEHFLLK